MELDAPQPGDCPICGGDVTFKLNKSGKPYFTCRSKCKTTVNLHGGDDALEAIEPYFDDAETDVSVEENSDPEPESGSDAESDRVSDLLTGGNTEDEDK